MSDTFEQSSIMELMRKYDSRVEPVERKPGSGRPPGTGKGWRRPAGHPDRRVYEPQALNGGNHQIIRLHLMGHKNKDIAAKVGVSPQTVSNTLNSQLGRAKLETLQEAADIAAVDISTRLKSSAIKAMDVMESFLEDDSVRDSIRLSAAKDVLDRAGHGAVKKSLVGVGHAVLDEEQRNAIRERAMKAFEAQGMLAQSEVLDV